MTDTTIRRPPFDPELEAVLETMGDARPGTLTADKIPLLRAGFPGAQTPAQLLETTSLEATDHVIPGHDGADIVVSVVQAKGRRGAGPGFVHLHGGGMVIGNRWEGVGSYAAWLHRYNGILVTVEYRLAPEFPDPVPVEDAYAALVWASGHRVELGIDERGIVVAGASAGAGIAAGVALLARDRLGPEIAGQLLVYPMLDDRDSTVSTHQFDGAGVWDRGSNIMGWTALLGDRKQTTDVSIYAAPARAMDLSGLPPAYIECGSAEVFRDEDVAYASAIWAAGGDVELHVWPGGFHGFDVIAPRARLSLDMVEARDRWIRRLLE